jgi:Flp pilus assembly pilin Flp
MVLETEMARWLDNFWLEEDGQDLVEYAVILTFIAITFLAFVYSGNASVNGIWTKENTNLVSANTIAKGG